MTTTSNSVSAALFDPRGCDDAHGHGHGHGHSHGHSHGHGQPDGQRESSEGTEIGGHAPVGSHGHAHSHGPGDHAAPALDAREGTKKFWWLLEHDGNTKR